MKLYAVLLFACLGFISKDMVAKKIKINKWDTNSLRNDLLTNGTSHVLDLLISVPLSFIDSSLRMQLLDSCLTPRNSLSESSPKYIKNLINESKNEKLKNLANQLLIETRKYSKFDSINRFSYNQVRPFERKVIDGLFHQYYGVDTNLQIIRKEMEVWYQIYVIRHRITEDEVFTVKFNVFKLADLLTRLDDKDVTTSKYLNEMLKADSSFKQGLMRYGTSPDIYPEKTIRLRHNYETIRDINFALEKEIIISNDTFDWQNLNKIDLFFSDDKCHAEYFFSGGDQYHSLIFVRPNLLYRTLQQWGIY